jgi:hypothetical protein
VGVCDGAALGTNDGELVGITVGKLDGAVVGVWVGALVLLQRFSLAGSGIWPSVHSQVKVVWSTTCASAQVVVKVSHPCEPSSHACKVGKCVGAVVGVAVGSCVGDVVGIEDGKYVGNGVGALVLLQLESSLVSVVYPSLHSHVYP